LSGWLGFETPPELLAKLERELDKLRQNPGDHDVAYNLFVTAWSLVDWFHPNDRDARERLRAANPILQVCAHLADGSKHFKLRNASHNSVVNTTRGANWAERPFGLSLGERPVSAAALFVHLTGEPAKRFGRFPSAVMLAEATVEWFRTYAARP